MARYAPTLFVGLGGSGVGVLRCIKNRLSLESEAIVFRGIDFDVMNGLNGDDVPELECGEFFHFDPAPIAEIVRSITVQATTTTSSASKPVHETVRDWYPDLEGTAIRYSQVEAAGARQWRALGRIGFFAHDFDILAAVLNGLAEVDNKRGAITAATSRTTVYLVCSIAGGTGAGLLLDVAASLRLKRPDVAVRAILLLPEFFEHVDFARKIAANAYATLWEIANFKNQHFDFVARYPKIDPITERQVTAPLQRVYVVGPYLGDRRPFLTPSEGYQHIADMLQVLITSELRSNATSYQANVDADGTVTLDDPAARDVFCSFSGAAIRLVSFKQLGRLIARVLVEEAVDARAPHPLFDSLEPPPDQQGLVDLAKEIERHVQSGGASLSETAIRALIDAQRPPDKWTAAKLRDYVATLVNCAEELTDSLELTETASGPLRRERELFDDWLRGELAGLRQKHAVHPHSLRLALLLLKGQVQRRLALKKPEPVAHLAQFPGWLDNRFGHWFLSIPLLKRHRLEKLRQHVAGELSRRYQGDGKALVEHVLRKHAENLINEELDKHDAEHEQIRPFRDVVLDASRDSTTEEKRTLDRMSIGPADADPVAILQRYLDKADTLQQDLLRRKVLTTFEAARRQFTLANSHSARTLHVEIGREIELHLAKVEAVHFSFVSPDVSYKPEVISALILKCTAEVFRTGRVDALVRHRTARLSVPGSFEGRKAFVAHLRKCCASLLNARVQEVPASPDDDRVLILVEDLFHPAEDISGIYEYYADYSRRPRRELFHIDRALPDKLPPLLTLAGSRGPISCGNSRCNADIRAVPPETPLCPQCRQPIRNRCGNKCSITNLSQRPDLSEVIASGFCPDCKKPLRTYWWHCKKHGRRIPMDKAHCPHCVHEGLRPDVRPTGESEYICPACSENGVKKPFLAKGKAADAMIRGANGQVVPETMRELDELLPDGMSCRKCGTRLVPYCPIEDQHPRHLLHRLSEAARWKCYIHIEQEILTCLRCGFPSLPAATHCSRCMTAFSHCAYCRRWLGIRSPKTGDAHRCPGCGLHETLVPPRSSCSEPEGQFCSNIFGCPAAGELETAFFPREVAACPVCKHGRNRLLRVYTRSMHVGSCSFCRELFSVDHAPPPRQDDRLCCLCGQRFADTAALVKDRPRFEPLLRVVQSLIAHQSAIEALRDLHLALSPDAVIEIPGLLRELASRICREPTRDVAIPRIHELLREYEKQYGCDSDSGTRSSEEKENTPAVPEERAQERSSREILLSVDYIRRLGPDDAPIRQWVDDVLDLAVTPVEVVAFLGRAIPKNPDDIMASRLQHIRRVALARIEERDQPGS